MIQTKGRYIKDKTYRDSIGIGNSLSMDIFIKCVASFVDIIRGG